MNLQVGASRIRLRSTVGSLIYIYIYLFIYLFKGYRSLWVIHPKTPLHSPDTTLSCEPLNPRPAHRKTRCGTLGLWTSREVSSFRGFGDLRVQTLRFRGLEFRGLGLGFPIISILLFRVLYWGPLFSETPK